MPINKSKSKEKLLIKEKIEHILDEMRVVLPGTEVLLGFQLSVFFAEGFNNLSIELKHIHLLSLGFILICIMLLMTPVAYHQIVDKGEDTLRLHKLARIILSMTLFFLGLGLAAEIYVITNITTKSNQFSIITSLGLLFFLYAFWFGYTFSKSRKK